MVAKIRTERKGQRDGPIVNVVTTFSVWHIAGTAVVCGLIAAPLTYLWLSPRSAGRAAVVGLVVFVATFGWRTVANMPQLNRDGVNGFSPNDLLAPVVTYVLLGILAAIWPPPEPLRFARLRALATGIVLAVNVITI
jgi:hypothetical protein